MFYEELTSLSPNANILLVLVNTVLAVYKHKIHVKTAEAAWLKLN